MKMEGRKEEQAMKKLRELLLEDVGVEVMSMDGGRVTRGQNFQLAISGLAKMNLKSLWMSSSILMDGNEDGKISLDEYIKV